MDKRYLFISLSSNLFQFFIYFQLSQLNVELSKKIILSESNFEKCRENLETAEKTLSYDFQQPNASLLQNPLKHPSKIPEVFSSSVLNLEENTKFEMQHENEMGCSCSKSDITNEEAQETDF